MNKPDSKNSVLVIGAGIAGIEASLNLAAYGITVYLVDDTPSIGGIMARLDKTFPTNDCSICIEAPKMYEVQKNPDIQLLTNCEVRRVDGAAGNFRVRLMQKGRFVDPAKCKGCGKCVEACPVTVPDEMDAKVGGTRKLIYIPFPQSVPNSYVIDNRCRYGKLKNEGACVGGCVIDCIQCRECPIARCVKACKEEGADAVMLWQKDVPVDIEVSAIIVASGLDVFEPSPGFYGYGAYKNVITHLQFERLMNAGGPTQGDIVRPSDKSHPRKIAWIQCVGREKSCIPYCSKVCCMVAAKQNIIAKEHDESVETFVFYNNLKAYGKGFHEFYRRAVELGAKYIKGKPSDVTENPRTGSLLVRYEDMEAGKVREIEVDLLVLSTGLVPNSRNRKLAKTLRVAVDDTGFFKENAASSGDPLETNVKGIYLCGGAIGPMDISESVAQAIAASLKAVLIK